MLKTRKNNICKFYSFVWMTLIAKYTIVQNFGVGKIFNMFLKKSYFVKYDSI